MQYDENRKQLNEILLKSTNIKEHKDEILLLIPELIICENCTQHHPAHIYNVLEHIFETVNKVDFDIILKLTALLHDIGKPYTKRIVDEVERFGGHEKVSEILAGFILDRLGYSEDIKCKVCILIKYHDHKTKGNIEGVKNTINLVGKELITDLLKIQTADISSHAPKYAEIMLGYLKSIKKVYTEHFIK